MTRPRTIDAAVRDQNLLGAALGDPQPWSNWVAVLRAAFGLQLSDAEKAVFHQVAGDRAPPSSRVRELWCVVGRRGGKSRMAAAIATFQAVFVQHKLAVGETGHVLVIAASRDQARVVFDYIKGFIEASPVLRQEIENITQSEIRLRNNIVISTHANSFRSIRGRTIVAAVFDEVALWRDGASNRQDDVDLLHADLGFTFRHSRSFSATRRSVRSATGTSSSARRSCCWRRWSFGRSGRSATNSSFNTGNSGLGRRF